MVKYAWPYQKEFASIYDSVWLTSEFFKAEAQHNINIVKKLLKPGSKWLDCGCGTGYFLSQFPGVHRAGFDLSPAMLEHAKKANPDAEFFRQMNLLNEEKEWHNQWDLVTSTGMPWSYLATMSEIEEVIKNLSSYVKNDGKLMLVPLDISDIIPGNFPHYYREEDLPSDYPIVTGIIWSLKESGVFHHNMIFPSTDQFVRWFSEYFKKIEIIPCSEISPPVAMPRRVIVCSEKREPGDKSPSQVINQPFIITDDYKVKFCTEEERTAYYAAKYAPPGLLDLPVSFYIDRFRPWKPKFWKSVYKVLRRKLG